MVAETTSRLEGALKSQKGDLKLVPYIMAGHPSAKRSIDVGKRLAASGVAGSWLPLLGSLSHLLRGSHHVFQSRFHLRPAARL